MRSATIMPHPPYTKPQPGPDWGRRLLLGFFALAAVFMIVLVVHALVVRPAIGRAIDTYTDVKPMEFTPPPMAKEEKAAIKDRIDAFFEEPEPAAPFEPGKPYTPPPPRKPLALSEDEVNTLLVEDDKEPNDGGAKFHFQDGAIVADLSLPIDDDWAVGPLKGLHGRYLNGTATIELKVDDGEPTILLKSFVVAGNPLPDWVLKILQREALEPQLLKSEDVREALGSLERLEIEDGQVTLVPKAR